MPWHGSAMAGLAFGAPMVFPGGRYPARRLGCILVLHDGPDPSSDFYLRGRLRAPGLPRAEFLDISTPAPGRLDSLDPDEGGLFVIICRYITADWLTELERQRDRLAGVAYFVDDDLPTMLRDRTLPLRYRLKIARRYGRHVARISGLASRLWVSTAALAEKYATHGAELLPPGPLADASDRPVRLFYHGTAAHLRESRWLAEVWRATRRRGVDATLELFGGRAVRRMFRGIGGVVVMHPLSWQDYVAWSAGESRDIGLAPLLPSAVNAARSPTRFFEITRLGAAGLYSDLPPYAGFVRDGEDGVLLPNDVEAWVAALVALIADGDRRRAIARAAALRCLARDDSLPRLLGTSAGPAGGGGCRPETATASRNEVRGSGPKKQQVRLACGGTGK